MKIGPRLAIIAMVAMMPTAVTLVAPLGTSTRPEPVPPKVTRQALAAPGAVAPEAQRLSSRDSATAREQAHGLDVSVTAASVPVAAPSGVSIVAVSWPAASDAKGTSVQYRMVRHGAWSDWTFLEVESDHRPDQAEARAIARAGKQLRSGSEPLILLHGTKVQVRLISPTSKPTPRGVEVEVVDPRWSPDAHVGLGTGAASAATQQPQIYTRADWGADESLRLQGPGEGTVQAAFVHHTAHLDDPNNPNAVNEYTSDQVPGIIQAIYAYHLSLGWSDIGYNFLVDRFGRTWEGRWGGIDRPVIGAHTYGLNDVTFGVSVLGNFEIAEPPTTVLDALSRLIAWKASIHHFNPGGTVVLDGVTYPTVEGHRAAQNNSTLCPGQYLYAKLPTVRAASWSLTHQTERWSGTDRYATAAAVSAATFPAGAPTVVVATGSNFPDALAGGPAGAKLGGPMLLTAKDALPKSTATEIQRLKPAKIYVLGGSGVISDAVVSQLASLGSSGTSTALSVVRVFGGDRYLTAAAVSKQAFPGGATTAFVATGSNFPDALAGGPAGAKLGGPVLLTAPGAVPAATLTELNRLHPKKIVALGGSGVISDAAVAQIYSATGVLPERWWGSDRYATAGTTSAQAFVNGSDVVLVSTGADFPDALAGGPSGGALGAPLLLTGRDTLPPATIAELKRLTPSRIVVLGGTGVVSQTVETQLRSYIVP